MSKQHNNESSGLSTARTACSVSAPRADGAQGSAYPRIVITGENLAETSPIPTGENLIQTDRVQFLSDGRHSKIVLHPIPLESVSPQIAHIDWFAFTLTPPQGEGVMWLIPQLAELFGVGAAIPTGKGWNGYKLRHTLTNGDGTDYGLLAHGGESQRGSIHLELNAQGCALVTNWERIKIWGEQNRVIITRLDLAHDDMNGDVATVGIALEWLQAGAFNLNGRPAKARLIDDLGTGDGKTLYIGKRQNGKMLRVYEKGKQLGDNESPWVRVEVELRNKSRFIPWDALICPGHYLAGAYPDALGYLSEVQVKIRTITNAVKISYKRAVENARQMTGKTVNVMMQFHGGDAFAVVNDLKRVGIPKRLENYADFLPEVLNEEGL